MAIAANAFAQQELVDIMVKHVRSSDPVISQRAITTFLRYTETVARVNGRIGKATLEDEAPASGVKRRVTTQGILPPSPPADGNQGRRFHPPSVPAQPDHGG